MQIGNNSKSGHVEKKQNKQWWYKQISKYENVHTNNNQKAFNNGKNDNENNGSSNKTNYNKNDLKDGKNDKETLTWIRNWSSIYAQNIFYKVRLKTI